MKLMSTMNQVFKASENDSICNIILGSRINKASFCVTSPKPTVEDAITICNRIVCICEDKSLQLYDTSGSKVINTLVLKFQIVFLYIFILKIVGVNEFNEQ